MKPRNVVLLAAGLGARLRPLTNNKPKALVECLGRPLLSYAIDFAKRAVISGGRIVVVGGFGWDQVRDYLGRAYPDVDLVENTEFEKANILSVAAGVRAVEGSFLLMNVDHIYPFSFADRLTAVPDGIFAAVDFDRQLVADDMKVQLGPGSKVTGISKQLQTWDCGYIGMTLVLDDGVADWRNRFENLLATQGGTGVAENVLQGLADVGKPVSICDLSGIGWLEIDTSEDLRIAEDRLTNDPDLLNRAFCHPVF